MTKRIALRPAVVLALVAACAPAAPTTSPPGPTSPAPTGSASTSPPGPTVTTPPQPSATPAPLAIALPQPGEAIPPGRYAYQQFDPPVTLDLDGSWLSLTQRETIFDVVTVPDQQLATLRVAIVDRVWGAGGAVETTTPDAAVAAIEANDRVDVVETSASRMGGLDGEQVTIERPGTAEPGVIDLVPVLDAGSFGILLGVGGRYWIAFFEAPQGLVAVIVGGRIERWDATLAAAEPVLESIAFGAP